MKKTKIILLPITVFKCLTNGSFYYILVVQTTHDKDNFIILIRTLKVRYTTNSLNSNWWNMVFTNTIRNTKSSVSKPIILLIFKIYLVWVVYEKLLLNFVCTYLQSYLRFTLDLNLLYKHMKGWGEKMSHFPWQPFCEHNPVDLIVVPPSHAV